MADVDMVDAPSGSAAPVKKATAKVKASAADSGADGKKRFEVKKVRQLEHLALALPSANTNKDIVECGRFMGLGYSCR